MPPRAGGGKGLDGCARARPVRRRPGVRRRRLRPARPPRWGGRPAGRLGGGNRSAVPSRISPRRRSAVSRCVWRGRCNVLQHKEGRACCNWFRSWRGFPAAAVELLLPAGRSRRSGQTGRGCPALVAGPVSRAVPQSGPARSLLQVSRWSSMELALAGRGQVSVGDCSVIGWGKMFGTGGARRMLSRMFGGEDAGLSLGDLSGGARAFQPGHAAKFAQGPRRSGSDGARGVPARPQPNVPPQRLVIAASQFDRRRKKEEPRAGASHRRATPATATPDPPRTPPHPAPQTHGMSPPLARTSTPTAPTAPTARPPPTEPTPPTPPPPRPTAPNPPTPQPRPPATKPETEPTLIPLPPPDPTETDSPALIPPTPHNADRHTRPTDPQPATPAPKQPKQNHKNRTQTPPQRKTDTAQPRRPPPAFATSANLGGPHGVRRELVYRRIFGSP